MAHQRVALGSVSAIRGIFSAPVRLMGFIALLGAGQAWAQPFDCSPEYQAFESAHRKVHKVEIWSPLDPIGAVRDRLRLAAGSQPLVTGSDFTCDAYRDTWEKLRARYAVLEPGQRFRLAVVLPSVTPCADCADPEVDVLFRVLSTDTISYATEVLESKPVIDRGLAPPGILPTTGTLLPRPMLTYDPSRKVFGGGSVVYNFSKGPIRTVSLDGGSSSPSRMGHAAMSGSSHIGDELLNDFFWQTGYQYDVLPAEHRSINRALAQANWLAASRAIGDLGFIFRYGAAFEAGHEQTTAADLLTDSLANNPYAAVKAYAGTTFQTGRHAFAASYGIQFGSSSGSDWDYTKHLANVSYSGRFLYREHEPITVDAILSAGWLSGAASRIPAAERFYGGNTVRNFIANDTWSVPAGPLIRSFPENWFSRTGQTFGGKDFQGASLTFAKVWKHYPAVPDEVSQEKALRRALGSEMELARLADVLTYLTDSPQYPALAANVAKLAPLVDKVESAVKAMPPNAQTDTSIKADVAELNGMFTAARRYIDNTKSNKSLALSAIRTLAIGFAVKGTDPASSQFDCDTGDTSLFPLSAQIACDVADIIDNLPDGLDGTALQNASGALVDETKKLAPQYEAIIKLPLLNNDDQQKIKQSLVEVDQVLKPMSDDVAKLASMVSPAPDSLKNLDADIRLAIASGPDFILKNPDQLTGIGDWLYSGFGALTPAFLETIAADIAAVSHDVTTPAAAPLLGDLSAKAGQLRELQTKGEKVMSGVMRTTYEQRSIRDTAFAGRVLDVIFRELNVYAISPMALFDVVRMGTPSPTSGGFRFALGPGVRLSLANWNFNLGYAWTLNRRPGDSPHALTVSLSISDLFR